MVQPHTLGDLYAEIRRTERPDQVANVLADTGPERLRGLTAQTFEKATPEERQWMLGRTVSKTTHVVWFLGPPTDANVPLIRYHDYGLHRSDVDYDAAVPCSVEAHRNPAFTTVENWHHHRYKWFVSMTLTGKGYAEDLVRAPEDIQLTSGPVGAGPPDWDGPSIPYWQPSAVELNNPETREYKFGDIAIMGLYDYHRLRDMCGTGTFFVQGPVALEASTVLEDDGSVIWQPSDFGPTRFNSLIRKLENAPRPNIVQVADGLL